MTIESATKATDTELMEFVDYLYNARSKTLMDEVIESEIEWAIRKGYLELGAYEMFCKQLNELYYNRGTISIGSRVKFHFNSPLNNGLCDFKFKDGSIKSFTNIRFNRAVYNYLTGQGIRQLSLF